MYVKVFGSQYIAVLAFDVATVILLVVIAFCFKEKRDNDKPLVFNATYLSISSNLCRVKSKLKLLHWWLCLNLGKLFLGISLMVLRPLTRPPERWEVVIWLIELSKHVVRHIFHTQLQLIFLGFGIFLWIHILKNLLQLKENEDTELTQVNHSGVHHPV